MSEFRKHLHRYKPRTNTVAHHLWRLGCARATEHEALAALDRFPHWFGHANTPDGARASISAKTLKALLQSADALPRHFQSLRVVRRGKPAGLYGRFNTDRWIKI